MFPNAQKTMASISHDLYKYNIWMPATSKAPTTLKKVRKMNDFRRSACLISSGRLTRDVQFMWC